MARRKPAYPTDTNASSGTAATVPSYENPAIPQFSRWAPEIYLPLNGAISDAGPLGRTTALYGPEAADFVSDSPFGPGQSLRINPDGVGLLNSGLQIESEALIDMSLSTNYPLPWALGFWFKASARPTVAFIVLQTVVPWALGGKGVKFNALGRLRISQQTSLDYEVSTTDFCDGSWHNFVISYPRYVLGRTQAGKIWVDGVYLAPATNLWQFDAPPATPTVKVMGCDTTQPFQIADFWHTNSTPPDNLASLLWNGGVGKRYSAAGLIA